MPHLWPGVTPGMCILWLGLVAGACAPSPQDNTWENPADHSSPTFTDISECRTDARRQAYLRYPDQAVRERDMVRYTSNPDRFPAENRFFEQCIGRKGFQRVQARAG